jgi:hypothetical protein
MADGNTDYFLRARGAGRLGGNATLKTLDIFFFCSGLSNKLNT